MLFSSIDLQLLKEKADQRAKNTDVSEALSSWFEPRSSLEIVDIHAGIGANLRSLAPLLPLDQKWVLYVCSEQERDIAKDYITRWAPSFRETRQGILLEREGLRLLLEFKLKNIVHYDGALREENVSLVVIDSTINELPLQAIQDIARDISQGKAALHARFVYDGRLKFQPHHAADNAFITALHRKMMTETVLGSAQGPHALNDLADQLRLNEYSILEGPSDLHVRETDTELMRSIQTQCADAQRILLKGGHEKIIDQWLAYKRRHIHICQKDLLALPP